MAATAMPTVQVDASPFARVTIKTDKGEVKTEAETPFSDMWMRVDRAVSEIVDKTTFAELLRSWTERQNRYVLNWEI